MRKEEKLVPTLNETDSEKIGLIGLSLSRCMRDIAEGKVQLKDVLAIVSGTMMCSTNKKVFTRQILSHYDWSGHPRKWIVHIINEIWPRLVQPRDNHVEPAHAPRAYWIEVPRYYS